MKIKKFLAGLAAAVCCLQGASALTGSAYDDFLLGDVNLDGTVNIMDVILLNKAVFGKTSLSFAQNEAADVDGNGFTDSTDALHIMKYIIKLTDSFENLANAESVPLSLTASNLSESVKAETVTGKTPNKQFINAQTGFYLMLFQETARQSREGENVLISPYSVMQALAMTANGADNETLTQMEDTLGGIEIDTLNQSLYAQRISQPNSTQKYNYCKLSTANSIWYRDDASRFEVFTDFLQANANYYDADIFKAPFDGSTVNDINAWVKDKTDSMIPSLLKEPPGNEAVMYLVNAVAFDAKWDEPYKDIQVRTEDFTAFDGTIQQADMMYNTQVFYADYPSEKLAYLKDDNAQGFYKYYEGGRYAFAALLPDESVSIQNYIAGLTPESLQEMLSNPINGNITLRTGLPKFSYDYSVKLKDALIDMGMTDAFLSNADFSRMGRTSTGQLYISDVLHKTHIEVNQLGTRAAAATAVVMAAGTALPPDDMQYIDVILNRPFVYCIVDTQTHLPVFMGAVMSIES